MIIHVLFHSSEFYNDSFFESLNGVCNALDNVDASKFYSVLV